MSTGEATPAGVPAMGSGVSPGQQSDPRASTAAVRAARPSAARAWWRLFRSELRLVFGRLRNLALLAVLAAVPMFLGVVIRININSVGGGEGPAATFLNALAGNGVFLALVALTFMLLLILPLSVAVVSGDSVAGEANYGTLRGLLVVPAGRTRLLGVKYATVVVFALAACLLVTAVSLIFGLALFHSGPVTLLSGSTVSLGNGVLRVLAVAVYAAAALAALGAIGLAASTFTQHPVGAIAATLVVVVGSEIADQVAQLNPIHPLLPSHFWLAWDGLFRAPVDFSGVRHGLLAFAAYVLVFGAIAWARFTAADITS